MIQVGNRGFAFYRTHRLQRAARRASEGTRGQPSQTGRRTEAFLNAHIHISPRRWPNDRGALRSPAQAFCSSSFINAPTDRLIGAFGESNLSEDNRRLPVTPSNRRVVQFNPEANS